MPIGGPIAASRRRDPDRTRRVPDNVQTACLMMIEQGLDFIAAAKAIGLQADSLRRHLRKPEVIGFLRREGARFRTSVIAANTSVLQSIRDDRDGNQMARVHAARELARQDEVASMQRSGELATPGITLKFVTYQTTPPARYAASQQYCSDEKQSMAPVVDVMPAKVIEVDE